MRRPNISSARKAPEGTEFLVAAVERLTREKADLLEEVRQLRAAVQIYRCIAEHNAEGVPKQHKEDAA